ncbi:MAG: phosphoribosylglycinamide formyltransferase [Balneolaceae bacterium]|nr:phosphoribosylglycinamide formyltransferase [Balneolaceae bacterium]
MKHIVVFASGSGTNFQAIINAVNSGQINARIKGLISDNPDCKALERAKQNDIEIKVIQPKNFENTQSFGSALISTLQTWKTDLIVLAGYLKKIPVSVIHEYENRIINIHPALLPKFGGKGFYGSKVHQAVLDAGEKESGCTVHIVTEEYDKGPILDQQKVPVYESDDVETLAQRILQQEHYLLSKVIGELIEDLNSKS